MESNPLGLLKKLHEHPRKDMPEIRSGMGCIGYSFRKTLRPFIPPIIRKDQECEYTAYNYYSISYLHSCLLLFTTNIISGISKPIAIQLRYGNINGG